MTIAIDLIYNLSLLIALSILSGFIESKWQRTTIVGAILQGALFGSAAVIGMLRPLVISPGLIFDGRSVMISLCGLFYGPVAVLTACLMTITCRIIQGGVGTVMGVAVILASALIGYLFYLRRKFNGYALTSLTLLIFGGIVHIAMLGLAFILPVATAINVIKKIGLPVILFYPLATVLIGKILSDQETHGNFVKSLAASEEKYRDIFENANIGIFQTTPAGQYLTINPAGAKMLGYDSPEAVFKAVHDIGSQIYVDPETRNKVLQALANTTNYYNYDADIHRADGQIRSIRLSVRSVRDDRENILYYEGFSEDITSQRQAEQALRENEERYRLLFQHAPLGIMHFDANGVILDMNDKFAAIIGASKDKILNFNMLKQLKDDAMLSAVKSSLGGETGYYEGNYQSVTGNKATPLRAIFNRVTDTNGIFIGAVGIFEDISERKRIEDALRRSEEEKTIILNHMSELVCYQNTDNKLLWVNKAFARAFNTTSDQLTNQTCYKVFQHQDKPCEGCPVIKTIHTGQSHEEEMTTPDGRIWMVNASPVKDQNGTVLGVIEVKNEITEKKKLENQLRQSQKLETIGTLAGGIAHDFNNILMAIIGNTEITMNSLAHDSLEYHSLEEVLKFSDRAQDLVKQILVFSRQSELKINPFDIDTLIKDSIKLLRATIPTTIDIRHNLLNEHTILLADETQIQQVIMNLGINAAHAMRDKGGILSINLHKVDLDFDAGTIHTDLKPGSYLKLTVSDTGHGMDQSVMGKIFDPFFTTKNIFEGTGLGLSVVHGIVKSHGGAITVSSEINQGSIFNVYLPIIDACLLVESNNSINIPGGNERILFVDDESSLVNLGKRILMKLGYSFDGVSNSQEALSMFQNHPDQYDLVITDYTMPHMTGVELAEKMLSIRKDLPIILFSGFSDKIIEEKATSIGIKAVAMKPMVIRKIASLIRDVLENKKS